MPVALVNPTVQAQGTLPASPLAGMFTNVMGAYGKTFMTPLERADVNYKNTEAQRAQQQMGAGQKLGNTMASLIASQKPQPVTADNNGVGPVPAPELGVTTPGLSTGDAVRKVLPDLVRYATEAGDPGKAAQLALLGTSFLPGTPAEMAKQASERSNMPTTEDMAMYGAGQGNVSQGRQIIDTTLGTPEMRNRMFRINQIVQQHAPANATPEQLARLTQQAADIVDGVVEGGLDPTTRQPYLLNKLDLMNGGNSPGGAGAAPVTPSASATPNNNPFNLRPVGATSGFQSFATPQEGFLAGIKDLSAKLSGQSKAMAGKQPTLRNIISVYSPPNENNTQALIANAAKRMGVDPDAPLNMSYLMPLAEAILTQEGHGGTTALASPGTTTTATPVAAPADASSYNLSKIPFSDLYGGGLGGAVVSRALNQASNIALGGSNEVDPTLGALEKLKSLNNALATLEAMHQGSKRGDVQAINRILENYPMTDANVLEHPEAGVQQGAWTPQTVMDFYKDKIADAVRKKAFAENELAQDKLHPQMSPEQRNNYTDMIQNAKEVLNIAQTLSGNDAAAPAAPAAAPPAPASNLAQGKALTAPLGTKVNLIAPDGITTGSAKSEDVPRLLKMGYKVRE